MIRRSALALAVALSIVAVTAGPAAAHGGLGSDDAEASNYRSRILEVEPRLDGVEVRVIEAGARLELTNSSGVDAVVLGYEGEPYLRVGPDGVFENTRSPATYLNADRYAEAPLPEEADAGAAPAWRRIADGTTARWHDHRAHWMGGSDPPAVRADPGREHLVVPEWTVPVELADGRSLTVTGELRWVPGPSPWPALVAAALLGLVVVLVGRRRPAPVAVVSFALLVVGALADAAGVWVASTDPAWGKAADLVTPAVCVSIGVAGVTQLRRSTDDGLLLLGVAGAGFAFVFGFTNLDWLGSSQLPTALAPGWSRISVTAALGLGLGLAVLGGRVAVARMRSGRTPRSATRPTPIGTGPAPAPSSPYPRQLVGGALALLALVVVVAVFTGDDDGDPAAVAAPSTHAQLCRAAALARDGERSQAEAIFFADVHRPLHALAQEAAREDRVAAGRLLRLKQEVEAARIDEPEAFGSALTRLVDAAADAVEVTEGERPTSCETGGAA